MPELIAGGPSIPVHLLNELDSGNVAFFCGAGISASPGSDLPGFARLVEYVYEANHIMPDAVEREALDLEEANPARQRPIFDKALGLLERSERLGTQVLRRTVIERLSVPPTAPLEVHKALIDLSRHEHGVHLITTNFDRRFLEAGLEEKLVDTAPKLPVPKRYDWSSLVHLHGRILPGDDGLNLVLTAADFGRAYLTERWAARFISELFREFTVVFVGYSISDPVMSYMVDALAAETAKGAQFGTAYAFAHHDGSGTSIQRTRDGWLAKNVRPILYDKRDTHVLLADTLKEWARIRKDTFHARVRIAINELNKMPAGPDDPVVNRVIWALQDPVAAKALADEPPIVDHGEFPKLERWIELFDELGLLDCAPAAHAAAAQEPQVVRLVDNGFQSGNPHNLDMTRVHLACWMARHLHVPQLLAWVVKKGGCLHPRLRQEIQRNLANQDLDIPQRLRLLWSVLLAAEPPDHWKHLWTSEQHLVAASDAERRRIEENAIQSISPRLIVAQGPASQLTFRQYFEATSSPIPPIDACGHLQLLAGDEDTRHRIEKILKHPDVLSRFAETLTGYLEHALALITEDGRVDQDSYLYRPSIAAHEQNSDHDHYGWTFLIDLVRDSYSELASTNRRRAENLLNCWSASDQPLFKRLALHAITQNEKADIKLAKHLLISGRKRGVWELELRREVLRFFRLAGSRLPRSLRAEIVRAIHAGPKAKRQQGIPNYAEIIRREKALRLYKLTVSGARLDKKSRTLAQEYTQDVEATMENRDEFLAWHGKARWIGDDEFAPRNLVHGSLADVVTALDRGDISSDELRGLVVQKPIKVAGALRRLAKRGQWPAEYWQALLWFLAEPRERTAQHTRLQQYIATVVLTAPRQLVNAIDSAFAGFVKRLAEEFDTDSEAELRTLWELAWIGKGDPRPQSLGIDDSLTEALNHPAGKLADAALLRLWKYKLQAGSGLPSEVRPYFVAIGADTDGHLGRVMLATRLNHLFTIDPEWTEENLIGRLSPPDSHEAAELWSAYGWSPSIGPGLLNAFKLPFLEFLQEQTERDHRLNNLRGLFLTVCLEAPNELTAQEIRSVVTTMSETDLRTILWSLRRRLSGDQAERAKIWSDKVFPWLHDYWPREANRNTAATSEAMLEMVVECGDAFPDAATWSLDYLRPLDGHGLYRLREGGRPEQYPDCLLQLLDRVVDAQVLPVHERNTLMQILDSLRAANAGFAGDGRFQRMYQIATQ